MCRGAESLARSGPFRPEEVHVSCQIVRSGAKGSFRPRDVILARIRAAPRTRPHTQRARPLQHRSRARLRARAAFLPLEGAVLREVPQDLPRANGTAAG